MGKLVSRPIFNHFHLHVRPGGDHLLTRPGYRWPPRTVTVKGGRRPSRSDSPLTVTSTAAGYVGRVSFAAVSANDDNSEGSSPSGAKIARILVFGRSVRIGTMMQSCASRRSSEAAGPFFIAARKPWRSVGSPPPRIVIGSPASMDCQCGCPVVARISLPSLMLPDARRHRPAPHLS
jgi:hypothetical protein